MLYILHKLCSIEEFKAQCPFLFLTAEAFEFSHKTYKNGKTDTVIFHLTDAFYPKYPTQNIMAGILSQLLTSSLGSS